MTPALVPAALVVLCLVLGALRARSRLAALPVLSAEAPGTDADLGDCRVVTAAGVTVDDGVRRAAAAHAVRHDLAAVDLVPAGLPVVTALELARAVDPATYHADRLARGRSAGHAMVVTGSLLQRAGVTETVGLDPVSFVRLAYRLKEYAPTGVDLAVAPGLPAIAADPNTRKARVRASGAVLPVDVTYPVRLLGPVAGYAVLLAVVAAAPAWGWIALVAYSLQPYLSTLGAPVRPANRHRASWLRLLTSPVRWWREARGTWRSPHDIELDVRRAQARAEYAADLAGGLDRFFEPRRYTCPWCGDRRLVTLLRMPDRVHGKPGRFMLDRCRACRHVFQNPRLSLAGLEFYYRDAYDGLGADSTHAAFDLHVRSYRGRAELVRRFADPGTWLDVGTGHGHFCMYAGAFFPDTVFDGLDMGVSVEEAQRRGWITNGYRGLFPELADKLADSYDVVSMHHYLEHVLDIRVELATAARVVRPGGHLLIEIPNSASRAGRLFRSFWLPYYQAEHLHMPPLENLEAALRENGLEPVATDQGRAHQPADFLAAGLLLLNSVSPDPDRPWATRPAAPGHRTLRRLLFVAAIPLLVAAAVLDILSDVAVRRTRGGNTYRVLARRTG